MNNVIMNMALNTFQINIRVCLSLCVWIHESFINITLIDYYDFYLIAFLCSILNQNLRFQQNKTNIQYISGERDGCVKL